MEGRGERDLPSRPVPLLLLYHSHIISRDMFGDDLARFGGPFSLSSFPIEVVPQSEQTQNERNAEWTDGRDARMPAAASASAGEG